MSKEDGRRDGFYCFQEFRELSGKRQDCVIFFASEYIIWHIYDDIRSVCLCGNMRSGEVTTYSRKYQVVFS